MRKPSPPEIIKLFPDQDALFEGVLEYGPGGDEWKFEENLEAKLNDRYGPQGWEVNTMHRSVKAFIMAVDEKLADSNLVDLMRGFLIESLPDYFVLVNVFSGLFEYETQTRLIAVCANEIWVAPPYEDSDAYLNELLKAGNFKPRG